MDEITAGALLPRGYPGGEAQPIPPMKNDDQAEVPKIEAEERQRRRDLRRAMTFGIVMATIQMGILLYFMYC